ncbi:MAG TPA: adenosylcobinamide-GDP ribazoletransferase [Syntrophobacteria bacterium]|nr:adenosylcobinamide-GDP ribazoletransferase [Syntrophobacteria bacterium]
MLGGLVTAFRTLTILPVPGRDAPEPAVSLPFFPVVGGVLGFFLWVLSLSTALFPDGGWPAGVAGLMLIAGSLLTRGLHLDGLADFTDALGGGRDRDRRLAIMKDTHMGAFGAIALVLLLLAKWLALTRLVASGSAAWVILVFAISRTMQVDLAVRLPYARPEGGTAHPYVTGAATWHRVVATVAAVAIAVGGYGLLGLGALAAGFVVTRLFGSWCRRHLGGITGDLLGAANELVELSLLFLAAAPGSRLMLYTGWSWIIS